MSKYDVAVVGFGPSGAVLACLLGQAGLRTLVIEKQAEVWPKPRAIAIDHEILRVLQNVGVADQVLPHTEPFTASQHFGVDGQLIRHVDMVPPPYPLGYVPSMVFTQPPVEAAIRAHAASFAGVEVVFGAAFAGFEQDADEVRIQLTDEGVTRTVRAAYLVGCDGASSPVRQHAGIVLRDLVFDEPWLVVDVRVNPAALGKLPMTAAQFCEPERPATFIVGPGNHRRWEIMLQEHEDPRAMEQEAAVWGLLSRWITPEDGTLWRASSYRFHALVAEEWRRGRVLIAGDAAHQQPPFLGQGMCQGIRDVANLAWKLEAVLGGIATDALLDTYAAERGTHVATLTSRIKAIGHAICERDPGAARARDARLIEEGGGRAPHVTRQEIVPPLETGLLADRPNPGRGMLFPQPWIVDGTGACRMDERTGSGWLLVLDGRADAAAWFRQGPHAVTVTQPGLASNGALVERDGVLAHWFDRLGCIGAIVRPDHYVFGTLTDETAVSVLEQWRSRAGVNDV